MGRPPSLHLSTFIRRARAAHGDCYGYDSVIYVNMHTKIDIRCLVHGIFSQTPATHLRGRGCSRCARENHVRRSGGDILIAARTFEIKARQIHGDKYDYSSSTYKSAVTKLAIGCRDHGLFYQTPNGHLDGAGCPHCGAISSKRKNRIRATKAALDMARSKHMNRYDYSQICDDAGVSNKVPIVCPTHGRFLLSLNCHKNRGCPQCGRASGPGWYSRRRLSKGDLDAIPALLYVIRVWSDQEEFLKVGITKLDLDKRMSELKKFYRFELLVSWSLFVPTAKRLEDQLKRILRTVRHVPKFRFGGHTECFSMSALRMVEQTMSPNLLDRHEIALSPSMPLLDSEEVRLFQQ